MCHCGVGCGLGFLSALGSAAVLVNFPVARTKYPIAAVKGGAVSECSIHGWLLQDRNGIAESSSFTCGSPETEREKGPGAGPHCSRSCPRELPVARLHFLTAHSALNPSECETTDEYTALMIWSSSESPPLNTGDFGKHLD